MAPTISPLPHPCATASPLSLEERPLAASRRMRNAGLVVRDPRRRAPHHEEPDGQIVQFVGWVEPAKPILFIKMQLMGIAEFIIGRAFARPVGSTHPTRCRVLRTRAPGRRTYSR